MKLIRPDDDAYEESRRVFNAMVDRRPAVIATCATPSDVTDALALAKREGYEVAVRAGGHSVAGLSMNDGGIVIDVRPMNNTAVDPDQQTIRVGAGALQGEFDRATQEHGLATTGGRVSTTGVAGFTLGGGSGWLERSFGFGCDNLIAAELVTADGREVRASESENPELFWALHGGGGNFGVITAFEFRVHPVGPIVLAGLLGWQGDAGRDVARVFRDLVHDTPEQLGAGLTMLTAPPLPFVPEHLQGKSAIAIAMCWAGDVDEGQEVVAPFRALEPDLDLVLPMPYADFQCIVDDPPNMYNYWTADCHDVFPDDALDVYVKYGLDLPSPLAQQTLVAWGDGVARVSDDATPIANRDAKWVTHPLGIWEDPADAEASISWVRNFRRDIARHATGGTYLNWIGNEGQDRIRAAYGDEKYRRLTEIKAEWDPTNLFRGNQNIEPAA